MRLFHVAVVTLAVLAGAGIAIGIMAWEPWADDVQTAEAPATTPTNTMEPSPVPDAPHLTGTEAAALVREHLESASPITGELITADCEAAEFNEAQQAWIVDCTLFDGKGMAFDTNTYRVYDLTGEVQQILEIPAIPGRR